MSRITAKFTELKNDGRKALITFLTGGDPNFHLSGLFLKEIVRSGADIIEVGMPFSDPIADGPAIQASSQRALKSGTTLTGLLEFIEKNRREIEAPVILMGYYNPIYRMGIRRFVDRANEIGVDGLIVADLPPDEGGEIIERSHENEIDTIFLFSPTTGEHRMRFLAQYSKGFIYFVSYTGVTGARSANIDEIRPYISKIRGCTPLPVVAGFGISNASQAQALAPSMDGIVVGSALVRLIEAGGSEEEMVFRTKSLVEELRRALDESQRSQSE